MAKYKEAPWWWYVATLVIAFVFGIVVVTKENINLPVWAFIVALVLGVIISPFVSDSELLKLTVPEHDAVLALRKRHRHKLTHEDGRWCHYSRPPDWKPVL